jgi:lysozyme
MKAAAWIAAGLSAGVLAFVANMEGEKLEAYPDPGYGWAVPTICSGHTLGVTKGQHATVAECRKFLSDDMQVSGREVARCVKVAITQEQFDALVSFDFNTGALCRSHLVELLNAGNCHGAARQFGLWVHSKGKRLPGLVRRREEESAMFERGCE